MAGVAVAWSGNEGSGKSTTIHWLAEELRLLGCEVVVSREPGGTPLAERIRDVLLWSEEEMMHQDTELLLMYASRAQHYNNLVLPALKANKIVLLDRWECSSFALQGAGRGMPRERIQAISKFVLDGYVPDLTILLDLPVEVGASRASARGRLDRFEKEGRDFFERVRLEFLDQAATYPERYRTIDASLSLDEVKAQIKRLIPEILALHSAH